MSVASEASERTDAPPCEASRKNRTVVRAPKGASIVTMENSVLTIRGLGEETDENGGPAQLLPLSAFQSPCRDKRGLYDLACSPDGRFVAGRYRSPTLVGYTTVARIFQIKLAEGQLCKEPLHLLSFVEGLESEGNERQCFFAPPNDAGRCEALCLSFGPDEMSMVSFKASDGWVDDGLPKRQKASGFAGRSFSGDGSLVHCVSPSGLATIANADSLISSAQLSLPSQQVAMSPEGRMFASLDDDSVTDLIVFHCPKTVGVGDGCVSALESKRSLPAGQGPMQQLEFTPDGQYVVYRGKTSDIFVDFATLGQTLQMERGDDCCRLLPADVRNRLGQFLVF